MVWENTNTTRYSYEILIHGSTIKVFLNLLLSLSQWFIRVGNRKIKCTFFAFYGEMIWMIQQYLHSHIFHFVHGPTSQKLFVCSVIHVVEVTQDDLESFLLNEWSLCLTPGKMIRSLASLRESYFRCSNMTILFKKAIGSIWKHSKGCFWFFLEYCLIGKSSTTFYQQPSLWSFHDHLNDPTLSHGPLSEEHLFMRLFQTSQTRWTGWTRPVAWR